MDPQHRPVPAGRRSCATDPTAERRGAARPSWYVERSEFWRKTLRGWDVAFLTMWALALGAFLLEGPDQGRPLAAGLAAFAVLLVGYVALGHRAAATADLRLAFAYLAVMFACVVVIVTQSPMGSLLLFIAYSQVWYFAPSRRAGIALTVVLSVLVFGSLGVLHDVDTPTEVAQLATEAGIAVAFAVLLGLWVTYVAEQSEERAELLARLEEAQAEAAEAAHATGVLAERERMAREIHDTLAQGFTSVIMLSQGASADLRRGATAEAAERLSLVERTARENLAEARALVAASAPVGLDDATLPEALRRLARRFADETGVEVRVVADDAVAPGREREVVLLRAAQEALSNVRRHAGARSVELVLAAGRAADGTPEVRLEVVDDGRGMEPSSVAGFGLRGMRDRVASGGGALTVGSAVGSGTRVEVRLPAGPTDGEEEPG